MENKKTILAACTTFILFVMLSLPVFAQEKGIHFEHGLTWQEVKEKAKKENKFIFMDCFTTWCGPCKMMSQQVFPLEEVGEFFNEKFVNVKVQMDKTNKDNEEIQKWYEDAAAIAKEYNVLAYPTFLYFNPDGKLVHLYVGSTKEGKEFIKVSGQALDPSTQHYTKMENAVKEAEGNPAKLREMAIEAKKKYDGVNAARLSQAYLKQQTNLFTKENLEFLDEFTNHSSDASFRIFMESPAKINAIMGKGFAQRKVTRVAMMESGANEWLMSKSDDGASAVKEKIRQQFPGMADMLIKKVDLLHLQFSGKKEEFAKEVIPFVKKYKNEIHPEELTSFARSLGRSDNRKMMKTALEWSRQAWEENPSEGPASVYATLLYRSGAKEKAIAMQKKVLELVKDNKYGIKHYEDMLAKMEKGDPL
ncbi:thioredoxin family protein [Pseudoflavitalea rhizosphaerae]|uniref:thioredoxin family protein n=1 Tax=Pseudoflavitalea rhizosphaerae TaxID=1884793 RepID=UPI000F8C499D|nr:thioredoxin fold domain-containing protein [Pseudoflavitalea rhizosphaerae]